MVLKRARKLFKNASRIGTAAAGVYALAIRPWHLHWGATDEEVEATLPGDGLIKDPIFASTRAVSIERPASEIWPWLVQWGAGRAGFYTYELLQKAIGEGESAHTVDPELQDLAEGDIVPLDPREPDAGLLVEALHPNEAIVLHGTWVPGRPMRGYPIETSSRSSWVDWSWTLALEPVVDDLTRLVARTRVSAGGGALSALIGGLVEPAHFVVERRMLLGIKARAEGLRAPPLGTIDALPWEIPAAEDNGLPVTTEEIEDPEGS